MQLTSKKATPMATTEDPKKAVRSKRVDHSTMEEVDTTATTMASKVTGPTTRTMTSIGQQMVTQEVAISLPNLHETYRLMTSLLRVTNLY